MNELKVFSNNEFGKLKTIVINNEVWFVANEVATILGYGNGNAKSKAITNSIVDHVDEEDRKMLDYTTCKKVFREYQNGDPTFKINSNGLRVINESGLFSLILGSKLSSAKKFKRWVTSEVLPQIRRTGGYIPVKQEDDEVTIMAKALQIMQNTLSKKDELIAMQQPKVEYYDNVLFSDKLITTTDIAKDLGMSAQKLNRLLHDNKIIYKSSGCWKPYSKYEYLIPEYADYVINEHGQQLKWTEKGREFIIELISKL